MKTTSRLAMAAAASVLATSAMAADLGGNCCGDLEERIAELEATTARKGNRKVSLTISGQIHESIMFWDDGVERNVYAGVNHINASSRFRFTGSGNIGADWSAGYLMEIETQGKSDSVDMNQVDQNNGSATGVIVRHNAWWIDNKRLGRVWLGLTDAATAGLDGINLSNSNIAANAKFGLTNGSFRLRGNAHATNATTGNLSALTWSAISGGNNGLVNLGDETRQNVIKYVSPTMMGFIFSAAWGEDDFWDASLKYANEFNGVRVAFGVGYAQTTDGNPGGAAPNVNAGTGQNHFRGCADLANSPVENGQDTDCSSWTIAGSLMHVATGLFIAGSYGEREDGNRKKLALDRFGDDSRVDDTDTFWQIRGGVERNWFGIGKTTLFGEYMMFEGGALANGNFQAGGAELGFQGTAQISNSNVDVWGLGAVQTIDAAAMDLYLTFRNYSADLTGVTSTAGGGFALGDVQKGTGVQDFQVITFGGRIQF